MQYQCCDASCTTEWPGDCETLQESVGVRVIPDFPCCDASCTTLFPAICPNQTEPEAFRMAGGDRYGCCNEDCTMIYPDACPGQFAPRAIPDDPESFCGVTVNNQPCNDCRFLFDYGFYVLDCSNVGYGARIDFGTGEDVKGPFFLFNTSWTVGQCLSEGAVVPFSPATNVSSTPTTAPTTGATSQTSKAALRLYHSAVSLATVSLLGVYMGI